MGDSRSRHLLDVHDRVVRQELDRFQGREVNTTGDGFVVAFDGPASGIRCGEAIIGALSGRGIGVRVGLHTGECERRDDDLAGLAVHIAARVAGLAEPSQMLVTSTVKDLVLGSGIQFLRRWPPRPEGRARVVASLPGDNVISVPVHREWVRPLGTWWENPQLIVGVPLSTGASRIEAAVWVDPCLKLPDDAALPNHYRCGHGCSSRTGTNGVIQCGWRHNADQFCGHGGSRRSKAVHPVRDNGSQRQGRNRGSGLPSVLRVGLQAVYAADITQPGAKAGTVLEQLPAAGSRVALDDTTIHRRLPHRVPVAFDLSLIAGLTAVATETVPVAEPGRLRECPPWP